MASPKVLRTSGINFSVRPGMASAFWLIRPPTRNFSALAPESATSFCR